MVKNLTIVQALKPFLGKPKESLHLSAISRELHEPHPTVRQWLRLLEEKGIVKKAYKGRMTLYQLNFEQPNIIDYLLITEKERVIEICDKELVLGELISILRNYTEVETKVLIFGSAVENFRAANDIDALVVGPISMENIRKKLEKINKEIHMIAVKSFEKVSETLKAEIIKKHILIKGSEEILRWMYW